MTATEAFSAICFELKRNKTTFQRDVQTRVTKKIYANNSEEVYTYEPSTSRLQTFKDAKNQTRTYAYDLADSVLQVAYSNAQYATPTQTYAYSPVYPRLTSASRGGSATTFTYYPVTTAGTLGANQLYEVDGPISGTTDKLVYTYDELGRVLSAKINGTGDTVTYDALGRVASAVNPLGTFTYAYINQTPRVDTITRTGGQFTVDYGYLPNAQDQRLSEIKTMGPSAAVISKFNSTYDAAGDIKTWTQQQAGNPQIWTLGYDAARQLRSVMVKDGVSNSALDTYGYGYDGAGNRSSWQKNGAVMSGTYNNLNQQSGSEAGGEVIVEGTVSEPAEVTVKGVPAVVDSGNKFRATVTVSAGVNQFPIVAKDGSGNVTTRTAQFTASGSGVSYGYDANGNLTAGASSRTFEWDAENRLLAVNYSGTGNRTEYDYDGLGRRIQIVEKTSGSVTSTKKFVWVGNRMAEERDAAGTTVTRRFNDQGEQIGGTAYFYAKDHLGSIRELTDTTGAIRARYTYDPYGVRTKVSGDLDASLGYTGHHYHARSDLVLSKYRPYIPELGRWISRDPIGEAGGINLYGYVQNNPTGYVDSLGLYITYRGGGSQAFWNNYRAAYAKTWNSPSGRALLCTAAASDRNIEIGPNPKGYPMMYDHIGHTTAMGDGTLRIDLNEKRFSQDSFDQASTWRAVPHEVQHALEHAYKQTDPANIGVNSPYDSGSPVNQMENRGSRAGNIVAREAGETIPNTVNSRGNNVPDPWGPCQ